MNVPAGMYAKVIPIVFVHVSPIFDGLTAELNPLSQQKRGRILRIKLQQFIERCESLAAVLSIVVGGGRGQQRIDLRPPVGHRRPRI